MFSETDSYASRVLQQHWPNVRNYGDVREFPSMSAWLLTAGVPCQPASVAGKRQGAADDRWLWPQTLAVVENGSYEWLLFENPTGILSLNDGMEFERICTSLESKGYEVQPLVIPACGVGAKHRRYRVWIVAHADGGNGHGRGGDVQMGRRRGAGSIEESCYARGNQWSVEPDVGRVAHGIPARVDRLRGLGNAIVPQVAYQIIKRMIEAEERLLSC